MVKEFRDGILGSGVAGWNIWLGNINLVLGVILTATMVTYYIIKICQSRKDKKKLE
jgi:hypothetical protein